MISTTKGEPYVLLPSSHHRGNYSDICHVVKSLQLIWRSGTCRWNLWVPDLQIDCSDFDIKIGHQDISPDNGHQGDMPYSCDALYLPFSVMTTLPRPSNKSDLATPLRANRIKSEIEGALGNSMTFATRLVSLWMNYKTAGIIPCMCPANERWRYIVTSSLIDRAHTQIWALKQKCEHYH